MGCCGSQSAGPVDIRDVYVLNEKIGAGAFGQVRACKHIKTGEERAVKVIWKEEEGVSLEELMEEIYIMQLMDHQYIIKLYEFFEDEKFLYCIMDQYTGGELFAKLKDRDQVMIADILRYITMMLEACKYLTGVSVVHRDIKPENFLFRSKAPDSPLCMIDFGLSQRVQPDEWISACCGTVQYLSPEQIRGRYRFTGDVWAVGVICYLLLFGKFPFTGQSDNGVMQEIISKDPFAKVDMKKLPEHGPDFLRRILDKDMNKRITASDGINHKFLTTPPEKQKPQAGQQNNAGLSVAGSTIAAAATCVAESRRARAIDHKVDAKEAQRDQVLSKLVEHHAERKASILPTRRSSKASRLSSGGIESTFSDVTPNGAQKTSGAYLTEAAPKQDRRQSFAQQVLGGLKLGGGNKTTATAPPPPPKLVAERDQAAGNKPLKSKFRDEKLESAMLHFRKANSIGGDTTFAAQLSADTVGHSASGVVKKDGKIRARTFSVLDSAQSDKTRDDLAAAFRSDAVKHADSSQRADIDQLKAFSNRKTAKAEDDDEDEDANASAPVPPPKIMMARQATMAQGQKPSETFEEEEEEDTFDADAVTAPANGIDVLPTTQVDHEREQQMDQLFEKANKKDPKSKGGIIGSIVSGSKRVMSGLAGGNNGDSTTAGKGSPIAGSKRKIVPQGNFTAGAPPPPVAQSTRNNPQLQGLAAQFRDGNDLS